jgi:hypothetical protein
VAELVVVVKDEPRVPYEPVVEVVAEHQEPQHFSRPQTSRILWPLLWDQPLLLLRVVPRPMDPTAVWATILALAPTSWAMAVAVAQVVDKLPVPEVGEVVVREPQQ